MGKYLNVRIGVEFHNLLINREPFKSNWKAVSAAFRLLEKLFEKDEQGKKPELPSTTVQKIFKPYTGGNYEAYVRVMEEAGLLKIRHSYWNGSSPRSKKINNNISNNSNIYTTPSKGNITYHNLVHNVSNNKLTQDNDSKFTTVKRYWITEKGVSLLLDSNREYLRKLHTDEKEIRRNQNAINKRRQRERESIAKEESSQQQEPFIEYIKDLQENLCFDYEGTTNLITNSDWKPNGKNKAYCSLLNFREHTFMALERNQTVGRIFHEWAQMKKELRRFFRYKGGMRYVATVDIRACHPTFLSSYILNLYKNTPKLQELAPLEEVEKEHERWINLFSDPLVDPRVTYAEQWGYSAPKQAKKAINVTLNGCENCKSLLAWMRNEFPALIKVWRKTNQKKTGPAITKLYECPIIIDTEVLEVAASLGLKLSYEYDGFGVFSNERNEDQLKERLLKIKTHLEERSKRLFGFPVVVKIDFV